MEITIQNNSENVNVIMNGNLDALVAEQIEAQVVELESMATKPMTIDCTQLGFIASSGLRILLRLRKAASASGVRVTLKGVNENVMEVLQVTHFDKMFVIA